MWNSLIPFSILTFLILQAGSALAYFDLPCISEPSSYWWEPGKVCSDAEQLPLKQGLKPPPPPSPATATFGRPPEVAVDLLKDPSPERAKNYVDWLLNQEKTVRLASYLVEEEIKKRRGEGSGIKDLKGVENLTMYYLFHTDCAWCRKVAPIVESLWRDGLDVEAYGWGDLEGFKKSYGLTFRIIEDREGQLMGMMGFTAHPAFVLYNKRQNKLYKFQGYKDIEGFREIVSKALLQ